jgi:N-acetylglucosamine repressor
MNAQLLFGTSETGTKANLSKKNSLKILILEELYRSGCKSIPDLSKSIRMSTPTITRAIDELMADELILEEGIGSSSGGRRPNLYGINPTSRYVMGIDVNRFYVRIGLFNFHNQPAAKIKVYNEGLETQENILSFLQKSVSDYIQEAGIDEKKLIGIGIAMPGLIDIHTGITYSYLHEEKPATIMFENMFNHPVFVEHDTRAMALGEQAFGLAKGKNNVLCLNIGSGIGLGMILNGKLYVGNSGFSGEFGHIQVDPEGELCYCGKIGCLETLASGTTMIKNAKKELEAGATSLLQTLSENNLENINSELILEAAHRGDQFAIGLLSSIGEHLGKGIAVLIHIFNPELIIVGGELTKADNYLIDPIQQNLNKYTISKIRRDAQIITSSLGNNAGMMGTVALVMNKVFNQE